MTAAPKPIASPEVPAAAVIAGAAPCSVRTCKHCGRRMPRKRGRAPEYCWAKKCQNAKRSEHRMRPKSPRTPKPPEPQATAEELLNAYRDGYEDGARPETTGPENNPFAWKNKKQDRQRASEWARGWCDGAEAFCIARDKARNDPDQRPPI